jgi:HEAT repeat protein
MRLSSINGKYSRAPRHQAVNSSAGSARQIPMPSPWPEGIMNLSLKLIVCLFAAWIPCAGSPSLFGQTAPAQPAEPMAHGKPLKYWIDALKDPEALVREEGILVLTDLGPVAKDAVPDLSKMLKDPSWRVRVKAANALFRIDRQQAKTVVPILCEGVKQGSSTERMQVIQLLGQIGPDAKDACLTLLEVLNDPDFNVRNTASFSIIQIGDAAVPPLRDALGNKDATTRQLAAETLGRMGSRAKDALAALKERLKDDDGLTRVRAAQALWFIDRQADVAVPALGEAMKDKDLTVRRAASLALFQLQPRPKEALPIFTAAMKDEDSLTRVQSAQAVWQINHKADEVMPVFMEVVKNPKEHALALNQTLTALNELGPEAKAAVPALVEVLKGPNNNLYVFALTNTLGTIGAASVPPLAELLNNKDTDPRILYPVIQALGRVGPEGAEPLIKAMDHENVNIRSQVVMSIGQMGPGAKAAVPKLAELAKGGDANLRNNAINALVQLGLDGRAAAPALVENLKNPNQYIVTQSLQALRNMQVDSKTVVPALEELLKSTTPYQRVMTADAIVSLDRENKAVVPVLIELVSDKQWWAQATQALGKMGPNAKEAVPDLVKLLKTPPTPFARTQILIALGQIGPDAMAAVPDLLDLIKAEKDLNVRNAALNALKAMHPDSKEVVAAMIAVMGETVTTPLTHYTAVEVLGQCGKKGKEAIPALVEALKPGDPLYRLRAADALAKIDPEQAKEKATPVLEELAAHPQYFRAQVASVMIGLDPDNSKAWEALHEALKEPAEYNRAQALEAVGQLGPAAKKELPLIKDALKDASPVVRAQAALALWRIDKQTDEAVAALVAIVKQKDLQYQRVPAVNTLAALGADAKKAVPDLLEARKDRDLNLRNAATDAIKKIDAEAFAKIGMPEK